MFSARTGWDLSPNDLTAALQGAHGDLIDLTASNPTRVDLAYPEQDILGSLHNPRALTYEPSPFGIARTREQVALHYHANGIDLRPERLVLTASSSESYSFLLKLLCDPGDEILVPRPSYPLFDDLARLECVGVRRYGLLYDGRWHLDAQSVREQCTDRTRAVFVVSPNNPTGSCLSADELAELEGIAAEHDLAIVSDEVFEDYVWEERPRRVRCVAASARCLSFSLGGLSKAACLPQMKLGWIAVGGEERVARQALARLEMVADTFLSVGAPVQHAVAGLLEAGRGVADQLARRVKTNLATLRDAMRPPSSVSVLNCEAGWYAVLRVPAVLSDEQWSVELVRSRSVVVHPGSFFGFEREGYLVVSLIPQPEAMAEGARRIAEYVEQSVR